jgi:hypothetical protein
LSEYKGKIIFIENVIDFRNKFVKKSFRIRIPGPGPGIKTLLGFWDSEILKSFCFYNSQMLWSGLFLRWVIDERPTKETWLSISEMKEKEKELKRQALKLRKQLIDMEKALGGKVAGSGSGSGSVVREGHGRAGTGPESDLNLNSPSSSERT